MRIRLDILMSNEGKEEEKNNPQRPATHRAPTNNIHKTKKRRKKRRTNTIDIDHQLVFILA